MCGFSPGGAHRCDSHKKDILGTNSTGGIIQILFWTASALMTTTVLTYFKSTFVQSSQCQHTLPWKFPSLKCIHLSLTHCRFWMISKVTQFAFEVIVLHPSQRRWAAGEARDENPQGLSH